MVRPAVASLTWCIANRRNVVVVPPLWPCVPPSALANSLKTDASSTDRRLMFSFNVPLLVTMAVQVRHRWRRTADGAMSVFTALLVCVSPCQSGVAGAGLQMAP